MSLEQTVDNLEIRYANAVTFVGTSNTMIDTTTGRIQTKGIQHNSNVITDISGPHGRVAPTLKKYPEIVFEASKMDGNDTTNTYVQAGYTVSASSQYTAADGSVYNVWKLFDEKLGGLTNGETWIHTLTGTVYDSNGDYVLSPANNLGTGADDGEWVKLELPNKITLERIHITPRELNRAPEDFKIYGSIDNVNWVEILSETGASPAITTGTSYTVDVRTTSYKYLGMVIKKIVGSGYFAIDNLELYGYEEDPPAGDHSVDTTFMSRFNNPQLTGVQVLVDGATGVGTNQISGGPDPSGNQSTYVTDGKYWTLNGTLTSNLSVEANTFLEGDQPHAVSVWFNSSNLEANVSNTCVFSVSDQEKLDSVNLDLQSNTWHNLTYAYQGEGGSRVTYLDGRKVAEDQAEDTFGEYPPFAMTGYSQGGYVLSVDADHDGTNKIWKAFDGDDSPSSVWFSQPGSLDADSSYQAGYARGNAGQSVTDTDGTTHSGSWGKIEFPYKFVLNYVRVHGGTPTASYWPHNPDDYVILGSNDDTNWDLLTTRTGANNGSSGMTTGGTNIDQYTVNATKAYKYIKFLVTKLGSTSGDREFIIASLKLYGHRENDLVRLPDPTNVLKYPHIAMTGPAQRGYVASASNQYDTPSLQLLSWMAFDNTTGTRWDTAGSGNYNSSGVHNGSVTTEVDGTPESGEWIQLEFPHKLRPSYFTLNTAIGTGGSFNYQERAPKTVLLVGSNTNNGTDWISLFNNTSTPRASTPSTTLVEAFTLSTTQSYKYFRLIVLTTFGGTSGSSASISELEFYGTGVDSIPIQIGGGNIDKVANFRVYDKFIGEDQALEIWDAQKDEFGRAKSSMTLQKGRLGIGTTEPEGRLAVLDEPHNLEEFPPRAMTGYKNYFEGHGEFCVYASTDYVDSNHEAWKSFNKFRGNDGWHTNGSNYTSGVYTAGKSLGGISGDYLVLKLPYKINLKSIAMVPRDGLPERGPGSGVILGSNDEVIWEQVHSFSGITYTDNVYTTIDAISSTKTYNAFAMVVTNLAGTGVYLNLAEWKLFGTREQGQSVLHDGQLTLTKNLNVPRIGPPLDADDTPRRDRLVVEYNTSTNPTFEGAVRDTSGRGLDGVFYGTNMNYSSTEKALVFNGTDDITENDLGKEVFKNSSVHTTSLWVKMNRHTSDNQTFFSLGNGADFTAGVLKHANFFHSTNHGLRLSFTHHDYRLGEVAPIGQWVHVAYTYDGTTWQNTTTPTNVNIYINGVKVAINSVYTVGGGPYTTNSILDLSVAQLALGAASTSSDTRDYSDVDISNFKLYDTALTAEEVKTLYDMGRTGSVANPQPLHIAAPVHINGPLYAPGAILNISQFVDDADREVVSSTAQVTGYTTPHISMKAGSKVKLDVYIPWRHDGTNLTSWRGGYHYIYFKLNKTVAGVAANTYVMLLNSGYHMVNGASGILTYVNNFYLPLSVPEDFTICFQHRFQAYSNTSTPFRINKSHNIHTYTDDNLLKLGFPKNNMGWSKYIITEISK